MVEQRSPMRNKKINREICVLERAKKLAQRYRALTGKPLGVAGEVAEYEAARLLGLELVAARQTGLRRPPPSQGTDRTA